jgi:hypothetical protein
MVQEQKKAVETLLLLQSSTIFLKGLLKSQYKQMGKIMIFKVKLWLYSTHLINEIQEKNDLVQTTEQN